MSILSESPSKHEIGRFHLAGLRENLMPDIPQTSSVTGEEVDIIRSGVLAGSGR